MRAVGVSYNKFKITLFAYNIHTEIFNPNLWLLTFLLYELWMFIGRDRQTNKQIERHTGEETVKQMDK